MKQLTYMQKNPRENFGTLEVDEYTNNYYIRIPEWVVNEFNWYDGTEINIEVDGESIIINERN
tara:strand:+ start:58 stop:246 length:189 start_codon:yes stop_codon:yes gene_type:complete